MKFTIVLLACFVGIAFSDDAANQLVDQVVDALKTQKGFDPMHVGKHTTELDRKIGLVTFKGKLIIKDATVTGLSRAARVGDAKIHNENGDFVATLELGDSDVKMHSNIELIVGLIQSHLTLDVDIGKLQIMFSAGLAAEGPSVKDFHIDEFEAVRIHVHGLGPLDPFIDIIGDAIITLANSQVREMISTMMRPIIESEVKKFLQNTTPAPAF